MLYFLMRVVLPGLLPVFASLAFDAQSLSGADPNPSPTGAYPIHAELYPTDAGIYPDGGQNPPPPPPPPA